MIKLNHLIKKETLYEGLIHTVAMDDTVDMLEKWGGATEKFKVIPKSQKIQLNFIDRLTEDEFTHLLKLINNLGWFVSGVLIFRSDLKWEKFDLNSFLKNDFDRRWISFQLEAKYDLEADVYDFDILFHVAPLENRDKILRIGLVPRSKEKILSHPERIYLTDTEEDANNIAFQFQRGNESSKWTLLQIDFKGVRKNNPSIRLFSDPNFRRALYTLSNIPPQFLKDLGQYDL